MKENKYYIHIRTTAISAQTSSYDRLKLIAAELNAFLTCSSVFFSFSFFSPIIFISSFNMLNCCQVVAYRTKLSLSPKHNKRMSLVLHVLQSNIVPHYKCILIRKYILIVSKYKIPFFEMMKILTKFVVVVIVCVGVTTGQDFFHYRT